MTVASSPARGGKPAEGWWRRGATCGNLTARDAAPSTMLRMLPLAVPGRIR